MKLVDTETHGPGEDELDHDGPAIPPRPEHRRVSVSLLFTLFVLSATVITVYVAIPERQDALLSAALEAQGEAEPAWDLDAPSPSQLRAWSLALFGRDPKWPTLAEGDAVLGVRRINIVNQYAGLVAFSISGDRITVVVQQPCQDASYTRRRQHGELEAISWRRDDLNFSVAGPRERAAWRGVFGVP